MMIVPRALPGRARSAAPVLLALSLLAACRDAPPRPPADAAPSAAVSAPPADSGATAAEPVNGAAAPVSPEQAAFDTAIIIAQAENPDAPEGMLRDLYEEWGSDLRGLRPSRVDLDGRGEPEYMLTSWCGSSGVCESYVFRREADGRFTRLLSAHTGEEGLLVLPHVTRGYHDLRSALPPEGNDRPGPFTYRYDGHAYSPSGYPVERPHAVAPN
jgi:hypothetical protein